MLAAERRHLLMKRSLDENVVALSMLGTVKSAQYSQSSARRALSGVERQWCCLLDELAWLCDYETGGKTVTSVAAQTTATGNVFWFANNRYTRKTIQEQLLWILNELQSITINPKIDKEEVRRRLFKKSIMFNHRRVESYWTKLHSLVQNAHLTDPDEQKDPQLVKFLAQLIKLRDNHEELCRLAFHFRDSHLSVRLRQQIRQSQPSSVWQAVRHYIGRLGSWWNACSTLVSTAQQDPTIFAKARVRPIFHRSDTRARSHLGETEPAQTGHSSNAEEDRDRWVSSAHVLLEQQWGEEAEVEYASRCQRRQAAKYIHAELLVLDHFNRYDLQFAEDIRYVGCSKLSCYCCYIYMKAHPLAILSRPCHGNTWVGWAMPALQSDPSRRFGAQDSELLVEMIRRTKHEIESGSFGAAKVKQLESTTGMTLEVSDVESVFMMTN